VVSLTVHGRVAVIRAGISGLAAAALLSRRHRVDLFEQERRLGGRTNTVLVDGPNGTVPLDTEPRPGQCVGSVPSRRRVHLVARVAPESRDSLAQIPTTHHQPWHATLYPPSNPWR
jgi:monoamine oxidase